MSVIWRSLWKLLLTGFEGMSEVIKAAQAMEGWRGIQLFHIPLEEFTSPSGLPSCQQQHQPLAVDAPVH